MSTQNPPTDTERGPEFERLYRLMYDATAHGGPGQGSLTTLARHLFDSGVRIVTPAAAGATCPECAAGKCRNCDGTAWDDSADELTGCACGHAEAIAGAR